MGDYKYQIIACFCNFTLQVLKKHIQKSSDKLSGVRSVTSIAPIQPSAPSAFEYACGSFQFALASKLAQRSRRKMNSAAILVVLVGSFCLPSALLVTVVPEPAPVIVTMRNDEISKLNKSNESSSFDVASKEMDASSCTLNCLMLEPPQYARCMDACRGIKSVHHLETPAVAAGKCVENCVAALGSHFVQHCRNHCGKGVARNVHTNAFLRDGAELQNQLTALLQAVAQAQNPLTVVIINPSQPAPPPQPTITLGSLLHSTEEIVTMLGEVIERQQQFVQTIRNSGVCNCVNKKNANKQPSVVPIPYADDKIAPHDTDNTTPAVTVSASPSPVQNTTQTKRVKKNLSQNSYYNV